VIVEKDRKVLVKKHLKMPPIERKGKERKIIYYTN